MKPLRLILAGLLLAFGIPEAAAQTRVVTGSVTDALSGEPVIGTEVSVAGTRIRAVVDEDGSFTLGVPPGTVTLVVRRIGYRKVELSIGPNQSTVTVSMERDVLQLEGVVVTGQATGVERRNLANAVSTVNAEAFEKVPASTVEQVLSGRVAGANIQSNSGAPGGGIQVQLRGVTSINADAQPIYVIDGIIVSDVAIPSNINEVTDAAGGSNPGLTQDNQVNRIVDINPADIESVEILKGSSASAIYGSKASNGVIIIRTKRGQSGRTQVNFSQRVGFRDLANTLVRDPSTWTVDQINDAFSGATLDTALAQFARNGGYDWETELAGRNPLSYESALSIAGGSEDTRYFISGLWRDEDGILPNTGFDKQSLRINVDQSFGDRLELQVSANLIHTLAQRGISNNDNTGTSPWFAGAFTPAWADIGPQSDGSFFENPFERSNPFQTLTLMQNDEDVWRQIGSARLEFEVLRNAQHDIRLIGVAGIDRFHQKNELLFPPELQFESGSGDADGLPGTSLLSNTDNANINLNLNAVWGYQPQSNIVATTSAGLQYDTRDLNTSRITTRNLLGDNIDLGASVEVDENRTRVEDLGFYFQEEVLIDDRLLLTAGFRADQSSANADDTKLFFYPKAAASYRLSLNQGILDEVKLRGAYGESGNQPQFGQKFTPLDASVNIQGIPAFQVPPGGGQAGSRIADPELRPERQKEIEVGFDATLADGRGTVEFTYYNRRVSDLVLERQVAPSTGFVQQVFNGGKLRVNGVEAALALVPIQTSDLNWVFRTTFFTNDSKVTELPVPAFFPNNAGFGTNFGSARIEEGESVTSLAGNLPCADFASEPACAGDGPDGIPNTGDEPTTFTGILGDANPDFKMSFSNDVRWKDWSLFFLLDWQQGGDAVNLTQLLFDAGANGKDCRVDATDPCNTRLGTFGTDLRVYIEDTSFLKLREVTVAYDVPPDVVRQLWGAIRSARITASARNWLTWTDYNGMDPEVSNFGNQQVGRNIDVAPYPRTRSFWFGFDLGF